MVLVDLQRLRPEFRAFISIKRQISITKTTDYDLGMAPFWKHNKLGLFNNGVCCGYDFKTKSRPASKIILFKLLPHKNNTLSRMYWRRLAGENAITHVLL